MTRNMQSKRRRSLKREARAIFRAGLNTVHAGEAVYRYMKVEKDKDKDFLILGKQKISLNETGRILVLGAGKASSQMARAVERRLGNRIDGGAVVTQYGYGERCRSIEILEASHPVPDSSGLEASRKIEELAAGARKEDLVIFLLSGGGSAMMPAPAPGISLEDKQSVTNSLLLAGAPIEALNCVRKHLSELKGGNLARTVFPARMIVLLVSDVIGDPLDVIGSGPASGDSTTFSQAKAYLQRYGVFRDMPEAIKKRIEAGCRGDIPDTPVPGDKIFSRVSHHVVANNKIAIKAAYEKAKSMGYSVKVQSDSLSGEAKDAGKSIAEDAKGILDNSRKKNSPQCLLYGGETTVRVLGNGVGGRCQELALSFAIEIGGHKNICLLAAGTDGKDGPTDAAGAIVDGKTAKTTQNQGLDPYAHLRDNNSHVFLHRRRACVYTGPSGTNVMDLVILLVNCC